MHFYVFETLTLDAAVPRKLQEFKRQRSRACLFGIHDRTGSSSDTDKLIVNPDRGAGEGGEGERGRERKKGGTCLARCEAST